MIIIPYLLIETNVRYFLPMMDSIGKRGIHFLWDSEHYVILIEGAENIAKVKKIWNIIKNGIDRYEEGNEET